MFYVIKGTFHVLGYAPDGDSIRFKANDPSNWGKLEGPAVKPNKKGHAQLRFEAIDTLETHYDHHHQASAYADGAMDFLMAELGIEDVVWGPTHYKVVAAKDGMPGYLLTRTTERYRRPVSFVFSGDPDLPDGSEVYLNGDILKASANYKIVEAGLAYPTFYTGLFYDLRSVITAATINARDQGRGLWPSDKTMTGVSLAGPDPVGSLENEVIMPKLFRRLISYLKENQDISGFKDYLAAHPDKVFIISQAHFTNLDTEVEVQNQTVRLTKAPEDFIFLE